MAACLPIYTAEQLKYLSEIPRSEVEKRKKEIRDIVEEALAIGGLEAIDFFVVVRNSSVILSNAQPGPSCFLCTSLDYAPRIKVEIITPGRQITESYKIHNYHFEILKNFQV